MGPVEVLWDGDGVPRKGHGATGSIMGLRWRIPSSGGSQTENITFQIYWISNTIRIFLDIAQTNQMDAQLLP